MEIYCKFQVNRHAPWYGKYLRAISQILARKKANTEDPSQMLFFLSVCFPFKDKILTANLENALGKHSILILFCKKYLKSLFKESK